MQPSARPERKVAKNTWKIFALVWNVPICSYYSISRLVVVTVGVGVFFFFSVYHSSFKYLTVSVYLMRKCKDNGLPFNVL